MKKVLIVNDLIKGGGVEKLLYDFVYRWHDKYDITVMSLYKEWDFYKICQVPFGFAVANNHPLANRKLITLEDLKGQTVLTLNAGSSNVIVQILSYLKQTDVNIVCHNGPEVNPLWESGFRRDILMVPLCWKDILINTVTIPFEKEFLLPYGVFYRPNPHAAVQKFLDFIIATYEGGNASGIVPVLE